MCGKPTALLSNLRGDVGIAPYANGKILPFSGAWPLLAGLPALCAFRGCRRSGGCGGDPYRIKPGFVEWERFFPLIRHALRRATFPVGEGCLPAGAFPYLPLGEGAARRRRMRGGMQNRPGTAPLPSGLRPATLSQERALAYSSSSFRTAMKASLGTDTVPKVRMRFLPSFCFSSSFFFLVMSPP